MWLLEALLTEGYHDPREIYISLRTDSALGSGTIEDPYTGVTSLSKSFNVTLNQDSNDSTNRTVLATLNAGTVHDLTEAIHTVGAYAYHFWMMAMTPIRRSSGNQYLHRKTDRYRDRVRRKLAAYERHIQIGLIAQGLWQYLALSFPRAVWQN